MESTLVDAGLKPRKFRALFISIGLGALLLTWAVCLYGIAVVQDNADKNLRQRVETDAVSLEDHATRTLDGIANRLNSLAALTTEQSLHGTLLADGALQKLINDERGLRSLSLMGPNGRILRSSNPGNVGIQLTDNEIPFDKRPTPDTVTWGPLLPYRDLNDLGNASPIPDLKLWLAHVPVEVNGQAYRWVAAINPGLLQNLWARIGRDSATGVSLLDFQGNVIASHNPHPESDPRLNREIARRAGMLDRNLFISEDQRFQVAYRNSANHPLILAVLGDRQKLDPQQETSRNHFILGGIIASVLLVVGLTLLYLWYLRYENSVIEVTNQARASAAHALISESDPEGCIIRVNQQLLDKTGYTEAELIGKNHRIFNSSYYPASYYQEMWSTLQAGRIWRGIFRNRKKNGEYYWVSSTIVPFVDAWGKITRYAAYYNDISEAIQLTDKLENERRLRRQLMVINQHLNNDATTDALTGVANRRGLEEFMEDAIATTRHHRRPVGLIMLDLDYFKQINDAHGHAVGDEVLKQVTRCWSERLRKRDRLARFGGEEFCIVLPNTSAQDTLTLAETLRLATEALGIEVTTVTPSIALKVTVSIGVCNLNSGPDLSGHQLILAADTALCQAKRSGRNRVTVSQGEHLPPLGFSDPENTPPT